MYLKLLLISILFLIPVNSYAFDGNISAKSAVLIEQSTGEILFKKNHNVRMKPASTTKILTAIIALENCDNNEIVTVSENADYTEGSSMYIEAGEQISVADLVYGLMLNSGNDAAVALAEHISGTQEKFSTLMNQKAKEIGALNSNFVTPNGLDDENHYTTAYDLALITSYAMNNETFREIVKTKNKIAETTDGKKKYLTNHNKLLSMYEGCEGVKTGFTKASGRTLVSSAERNSMRLIAVTLNAPNDWNDHVEMLNYGFDNFETATPLHKDFVCCHLPVKEGVLEFIPLVPEKTVSYLGEKNTSHLYNVEYRIGEVSAPVEKNSIAGEAVITFDGEIKDIVKLKTILDSSKSVRRKNFAQHFRIFAKIFLRADIF